MAKDAKKERPGGAAPPRTEEALPRLPSEKVAKKKLQLKVAQDAKDAKKAKRAPKVREDAIETNIEEGEEGADANMDDGPVIEREGDLFDELPEGDLNVRTASALSGCVDYLLHRLLLVNNKERVQQPCRAIYIEAVHLSIRSVPRVFLRLCSVLGSAAVVWSPPAAGLIPPGSAQYYPLSIS